MSDIVERLRAWVYTDSLYATAREAAAEIERLRQVVDQKNLTDAERVAVEMGISSCEQIGQYQQWADRLNAQAAATLRGLLERLGGGK